VAEEWQDPFKYETVRDGIPAWGAIVMAITGVLVCCLLGLLIGLAALAL
jgi:hypothetical protein